MLLDLNDVGLGIIPYDNNELTEVTHYIRNTLDTISCNVAQKISGESLNRLIQVARASEATSIKKDICWTSILFDIGRNIKT